jgi:hypothetical protein
MLPRYTCFSARLMGSQRLRIQVEYSMFASLVVLGGYSAMSSREWWGTGWGMLIGGANRQMQPIQLQESQQALPSMCNVALFLSERCCALGGQACAANKCTFLY